MNWQAINWHWTTDDTWIVVTGALCAIAAAIPGTFLVLRRMSLMGDAISHAVLPGLVLGFFVAGTRDGLPMLIGATLTGLLTSWLADWIHRHARVDEGAALGIVYTTLFSIGLVLIVQFSDQIDLDPSCVLYGSLELTALDVVSWWGFEIPRSVITLSIMASLNALVIFIGYRFFVITTFDPGLARSLGLRADLAQTLLMILVALTSVTCFQSVGNILVVAMFIAPAATARLLTDHLPTTLFLSAFLGVLAAFSGHVAAIVLPGLVGLESTHSSAMIAVAAGTIFLATYLFSPKYGLIASIIRKATLRWQILTDDIVALLFRLDEKSQPISPDAIPRLLLIGPWTWQMARRRLSLIGWVTTEAGSCKLTASGRAHALTIVRSHRLWEAYLAQEAGLSPDQVHPTAEQLEHFTDPKLRDALSSVIADQTADPHGKPIPTE